MDFGRVGQGFLSDHFSHSGNEEIHFKWKLCAHFVFLNFLCLSDIELVSNSLVQISVLKPCFAFSVLGILWNKVWSIHVLKDSQEYLGFTLYTLHQCVLLGSHMISWKTSFQLLQNMPGSHCQHFPWGVLSEYTCLHCALEASLLRRCLSSEFSLFFFRPFKNHSKCGENPITLFQWAVI